MDSVGEDCNELKRTYDDCFNKFFSEQFLKGMKTDPCVGLFRVYQDCVKRALKTKGINMEGLEENVLGTEKEKKPPS